MRRAFTPGLALLALVVLGGCKDSGTSTEPSLHTTSVDPNKVAACQILLGPPTDVAVKYVEDLRNQDAAAIYRIAATGLRAAVSKRKFLATTDLTDVTDARISNVVQVGTKDGKEYAVVPIQVTAGGSVQDGRLILIHEGGHWRYFDSVAPDQAPTITSKDC